MILIFVVLGIGGFSKSQRGLKLKIVILLSNKAFITLQNICHKLYHIMLFFPPIAISVACGSSQTSD